MIITCEKCSTSFNLDDSFIKKGGSKVRCSVCKDIFTAFPASNELEPDTEIPGDLNLDADSPDDQSFESTEDFQIEDDDFSMEESDLTDSDLSLEDTEIPDSDLSDSDLSDSDLSDSDLSDSDLSDSDLSLDEDDIVSIEDSDLEFKTDSMEPEELLSEEVEPSEMFSDDSDEDFSFEDNEFEIEIEAPSEDSPDEFGFEEDAAFDTFEIDEEELEGDEGELEIEEGGLEFETIDEEEIPALVTQLESSDIEPSGFESPESEDSNKESNDITFTEEDEFDLEFDVTDDTFNGTDTAIETDQTEDISDTQDGSEFEIETEPIEGENTFSMDETDDTEIPIITPEENLSEYDNALEQETETNVKPLEKNESLRGEEEPFAGPGTTIQKRKKQQAVGTPVLVLCLIILLIFGAYIASFMTGYKIPYLSDIKIPYIEQYLKKPAPEVNEAKPVPNQKSVNGRFVTNSTAGTLFIITGRIENPSSIAYSHIKILGTLITKGKIEAKTKTAYCGNIVSEEMLKTGNILDINKILLTKTGNLNSNVSVKPGTTIPFMVVFSDLPEKLQNFTVRVTSFDKATN